MAEIAATMSVHPLRRLPGVAIVLTLLVVGFAIAAPGFLSPPNIANVLVQSTLLLLLSLPMTLVIMTEGLDLSMGAVVTLASIVVALVSLATGSMPLGLLAAVAVGVVFGLVNGYLVAGLNIPPFVATLGTLGIIRGLTLIITNGLPVHGVPQGFSFLGEGNLLGVPFVLWVLVVCALATHVILEHTRLGRYAYAIGSNPDAAVYAGVPVGFDTTTVYALGGMLTGLAGMIEASRLMTGQPAAGNGYELQAIAAVVIGGGSLHGGEGSVVGTLIGAFIMGLLSNGSDLLGVSPYLQQAIIGAVIILAVTVDELRKRRLV